MISVIIPLYNVEKYIERCLLSFENQKYKNFEIIIVNDGTKDCSAELVKAYMKKSKLKILLIEQKNAGVSVARNKGIENSKGQYICFTDSDDMVTPDYLSEMRKIIVDNKSDMVICGVKTIDEQSQSNIIESNQCNVENMESITALKRFLYRDLHPGVWAILVKADIINKNNLKFAEGYRYSEDIEYIYKLLSNSKIISHTRSKLYLYRVRNTSVMSIVDNKRMDGYELMEGLKQHFLETNSEFSKEFEKFGVARWVWGTLWQIALASEDYKNFRRNISCYNVKENMHKLIKFPDRKVSISSFIYTLSPWVYYNGVRLFFSKRTSGRKFLLK